LEEGEKTAGSGINGVMDAILSRGITGNDSNSLRNQQLMLKDELKRSIAAGRGTDVIRIQNLLRELPVHLAAAEIGEIRKGIDDASARLGELKPEIEYLEGVRAQRNKLLADKIKDMEEAALSVQKVELALYQMDNETARLLEERRELNKKLKTYIASAEAQIGEE
jgi:uncharacterized protein YdcH (DUF465 family)